MQLTPMEEYAPLPYFIDALGNELFGEDYLSPQRWPVLPMRHYCEGLVALHWHYLRGLISRTKKRADQIEESMAQLCSRKCCARVSWAPLWPSARCSLDHMHMRTLVAMT